MAIKQVVSQGIGFDAGQIGWVVTEGFGALTVSGGGFGGVAGLGRAGRRRRAVVVFLLTLLLVVAHG